MRFRRGGGDEWEGVVRALGRSCGQERLGLLLMCFCSLGGMFVGQVSAFGL